MAWLPHPAAGGLALVGAELRAWARSLPPVRQAALADPERQAAVTQPLPQGVAVVSDLGPVRYEPPLTGSSAWPPGHHDIALPTGPRWVAGPSRWHRVRSALVLTRIRRDTVYHLWCGQARFASHRPPTSDELPTDGRPLCGTCEGRAAGAGHSGPLAGADLLFSPWGLRPPRWCPGGAPKGMLAEVSIALSDDLGRLIRCAVCGNIGRYKNMGWNDWRPMPAGHEPGPALVPGCPQHAWRELDWRDSEVWCRCGRRLYWPE